jgi:chemotaxis protein CheC
VKPLTARQEDALREVALLGSAQAASMLARLVGDVGVLVDVPQVLSASRWQLGWLLGGGDVKVLAATFGIEGDVTGQLWWVMKRDDAERLGQRLLQRPGVQGRLAGAVGGALAEAANIVASSCLSAIGTMVHATLLPSTPELFEVSVAELVGEPTDTTFRTVLGAPFVSTNAPTFAGWLLVLVDESRRDVLLQRLGLQ